MSRQPDPDLQLLKVQGHAVALKAPAEARGRISMHRAVSEARRLVPHVLAVAVFYGNSAEADKYVVHPNGAHPPRRLEKPGSPGGRRWGAKT